MAVERVAVDEDGARGGGDVDATLPTLEDLASPLPSTCDLAKPQAFTRRRAWPGKKEQA